MAMTVDLSSAPGRPALGIYAKSSDGAAAHIHTQSAARGSRFRLQRVAAALLYVPGAVKQDRVCTCHRQRKAETVKVLVNTKTKLAHFNGLETCSRVWTCPVCSFIITEERRREIQAGITAHVGKGGEVYLMTLTQPHARQDRLAVRLDLQRKAVKLLRESAAYKRVSKEIGRIGNIRALETTWGSRHGWHPHLHELVFAAPGMVERLKELAAVWIECLIAVGAADRSQRNDMLAGREGESVAFDVRRGVAAAAYVAKFGHEPAFTSRAAAGETWGAAAELAKGHSKIARRMLGRTPFSLLLDYEDGDKQAGELFREYAEAMKNERQLYWSPKLRARLGLSDEADDAALVERSLEELQPQVVLAAELTPEQWKLVVAHNARYALLRCAELHGAAGIRIFLDELRARAPTHAATMTESRRWN